MVLHFIRSITISLPVFFPACFLEHHKFLVLQQGGYFFAFKYIYLYDKLDKSGSITFLILTEKILN